MDCLLSVFELKTLIRKSIANSCNLLSFLLVGYCARICLWIQHNQAIIPDSTWTIIQIIALPQHCPKFINFVIPFWQELEWILGERLFKQTVSKILHCGFKLFLFHVWELRKFLCSTEQVNIQTSIMNSDDSSDAESVSLFKVIVWFCKLHKNTKYYRESWAPLFIRLWITRDVKLPTTNQAGPTQ